MRMPLAQPTSRNVPLRCIASAIKPREASSRSVAPVTRLSVGILGSKVCWFDQRCHGLVPRIFIDPALRQGPIDCGHLLPGTLFQVFDRWIWIGLWHRTSWQRTEEVVYGLTYASEVFSANCTGRLGLRAPVFIPRMDAQRRMSAGRAERSA